MMDGCFYRLPFSADYDLALRGKSIVKGGRSFHSRNDLRKEATQYEN